MIDIKPISAQETYEIRKEILRRNINLTEKIDDDFSETSFHLGAYVNNKLVSVATFMQHNNENFTGKQYRLRGMATLDAYQKKGLGKMLIFEGVKKLKKIGVETLWCNARTSALQFYQKLGFKTIGTEFDIHLIGPHYVMFLRLEDD